jgi:hypothetical protein
MSIGIKYLMNFSYFPFMIDPVVSGFGLHKFRCDLNVTGTKPRIIPEKEWIDSGE